MAKSRKFYRVEETTLDIDDEFIFGPFVRDFVRQSNAEKFYMKMLKLNKDNGYKDVTIKLYKMEEIVPEMIDILYGNKKK